MIKKILPAVFAAALCALCGCSGATIYSDYREVADALPALGLPAIGEDAPQILRVNPYPGMVYPELRDGLKYILLGTYHSGTIDTRSQMAREYFARARERGIKAYVTGVADGPEYESASLFESLGITPIKNISPIAAYIKLWLLSNEAGDVTKKLTLSLGGDLLD